MVVVIRLQVFSPSETVVIRSKKYTLTIDLGDKIQMFSSTVRTIIFVLVL